MTAPAARPEVVLLNPPATEVREPYYDQPNHPDIGIAYVGSYLEAHGGIRPTLIDGKFERLTPADVVELIVSLEPGIVGISAMTHMVKTAARIAREIKDRLPDTTFVLGGFHATFLPERTLEEFPVFDYLVVGEGEIAFLKLVESLRAGQREPMIPGVWYDHGLLVKSGRGEIPDTLDELGTPGWHLFDRERLERYCKVLPLITQRGCPFSCNFCSRPYGQKVRARTANHVGDEIQYLTEEFGIHDLLFFDETFTLNKKHVLAICNEILDRGLEVRWFSNLHANTADREMFEMMDRAGCVEIGYGVESGDDLILARMQKRVTKKRLLDAAQMLREVGVPFAGYFIFGHPNETIETALETIRFARELDATRVAFGVMVPYPGTEVWEMAIKGEGGYRRISDDWDEYNKHFGNAVELEDLSREVLGVLKVAAYLYAYFFNPHSEEFLAAIHRGASPAEMRTALGQHIELVRRHYLSGPRATERRNPKLHEELFDYILKAYSSLAPDSVAELAAEVA